MIFACSSAFGQNTKGDKAAGTQKSIFRIPRLKSKAKGGDKAYVGDISGRRRIRTKNKSSAVRAIQTQPARYANRKPSGDRAYRPRGGTKLRIRSKTAEASRNNVYPSNWQFSNNPSPYPKNNQRAYSNRRAVSRAASLGTKRPPPGGRKRIVTARSASRSYVTRGRRNVYWGKFRKGEKPFTTDIAGRTIRAKNFHSPGLGVIPAPNVYRGRKRIGDRSYKGTFKSGYVTTPRTTRPWRGDVSGHAIRSRPPKVSQEPGHMFEPRRLSISGKPRVGKPLHALPSSASGRISNRAIQRKAPGLGAMLLDRALGKFRGKKKPPGGVSHSKGFNNNGQPIMGKAPGMGGKYVDRYKGFFKGGLKAFSAEGYAFSGSIKSRRAPKGGGSISARRRNNFGQPIDVKGPGIGARFVDTYRGSIKFRRAAKGGGSVSGKRWNNFGQPIDVKGPGIGGRFVDVYQGFYKARRPLKGGGSISGKRWNNNGQPIDVKGPGIGGRFADVYQGNLKLHREPKGGGSISARPRDNSGNPIPGKIPAGVQAKFVDAYQGFLKKRTKTFNTDGYGYTGNLRYFKEPKGGGSISGKLWNNSNRPIAVKPPAGVQAKYIDVYQGFSKGHKPLKGGGSVSGKLWNNNEKPIEGKAFPPASLKVSEFKGDKKQATYVRNPNQKEEALKKLRPGKSTYLVGDLQVKTKARKYERNPNQKEEALKKVSPGKSTYLVGNLQVKTKAKDYDRNPHSSKDALKTVSNGKNSVRAIEYSNRIKQLWVKTFGSDKDLAGRTVMRKYVRNPNSKKEALMVMAPGRANARIKDLQVNVKMLKPHGNNLHPDSKFAHSLRDNVKQERTFLMNLKLKWAKLFRKNDTQPAAVKDKVRRPRYDPKERDLWKDLYD